MTYQDIGPVGQKMSSYGTQQTWGFQAEEAICVTSLSEGYSHASMAFTLKVSQKVQPDRET